MTRSLANVARMAHLAAKLLATIACLAATALSPAQAADRAAAMRERYIGPEGLPSPTAYDRAHGLAPAPGSESYSWQPVFKVAVRTADLGRLAEAELLTTDCYFIRAHRYTAPNRAQIDWNGRVYAEGDRLAVGAYTKTYGERRAGYIDPETGAVQAEPDPAAPADIEFPDFADVKYNPFTGQLWRKVRGGPIEEDQRFYLPLPTADETGRQTILATNIARSSDGRLSLVATDSGRAIATCNLATQRATSQSPGYAPGLAPGCKMLTDDPTTILEFAGEISGEALDARFAQLTVRQPAAAGDAVAPVAAAIDGRFDEWRGVSGIADPRGDIVSYLQYNPDADLLEFKVTSDDRYLYTYTRVAGQHGRTAPGRDRYYFYVYIDADRDPTTGYSPTRDDDCYYGVTLGDDCESQYEFVGGRFLKTFFGFTGVGTEREVLAGKLTLGPSWYSRNDPEGNLRDRYKVEYVHRGGQRSITEDFTEGTSDDIVIALSPDGSECEMRTELAGFLVDANGKPLIAAGQAVDLAAGVEASGAAAGNAAWGADSTAIIYGYKIGGR
jgi:hypothetical protein